MKKKTSENFAKLPSKSFFFPQAKQPVLDEECFIPEHFQLRAIGGTSNQCIVKCHRKLGVRKVNEPTFSIIPVGVFMGEKLITCDKYTGAWTSCHFCQAACEQKHFSSAVILAMDLPNQCSMRKLISKHTHTHTLQKLHNQSYIP